MRHASLPRARSCSTASAVSGWPRCIRTMCCIKPRLSRPWKALALAHIRHRNSCHDRCWPRRRRTRRPATALSSLVCGTGGPSGTKPCCGAGSRSTSMPPISCVSPVDPRVSLSSAMLKCGARIPKPGCAAASSSTSIRSSSSKSSSGAPRASSAAPPGMLPWTSLPAASAAPASSAVPPPSECSAPDACSLRARGGAAASPGSPAAATARLQSGTLTMPGAKREDVARAPPETNPADGPATLASSRRSAVLARIAAAWRAAD